MVGARTLHGLMALQWLAPMMGGSALLHVAGAQLIMGSVTDESRGPISGALIVRLDSTGGAIASTLSDELGRFSFRVAPGLHRLRAQRIGFAPSNTSVAVTTSGDRRDVLLTLRRVAVTLDTVRSEGRTHSLTLGREYLARHIADGKGLFASGAEIELSRMSLSQYIANLPGMKAWPKPNAQAGFRSNIIGKNGRFIAPAGNPACAYLRVDRKIVDANFYARQAVNNIDDALPLERVMAVEIYRRFEDVPEEWRLDAWPTPSAAALRDRHQHSPPKCAFVQIWTNIAW